MSLTFDEKLLIEQIRAMEGAGDLSPPEHQATSQSTSFEQRLHHRAQAIKQQDNLHPHITHAARLSRLLSLGLIILSACVGGVAVLQAIQSSDTTLNIYWLIVILLGFHFISLGLWITGMIFLRSTGSNQTLLGTLWRWIEPHVINKNPYQAAADKAWFNTCHHGTTGRWWLSGLSHSMWLSYLLAGFLVLLLLLMTRQFDFIWASTILSNDVFLVLTNTLATPLQCLGITTPNMDQIKLSQHGIDHNVQGELRQTWAMFLLGGLFVYGLLPRIALLLFSKLMEHIARKAFQLDLNLPYYINLRHQLMPTSSKGKIIDPDIKTSASPQHQYQAINADPIPDNARWIALELTSETHWPLTNSQNNLGHITGSDSLATVLDKLNNNNNKPLVIAVSINRLADRGLKRALLELYATTTPANRWLAILNNTSDNLAVEQLNNWRSVANTCDITEHHLAIINGAKT